MKDISKMSHYIVDFLPLLFDIFDLFQYTGLLTVLLIFFHHTFYKYLVLMLLGSAILWLSIRSSIQAQESQQWHYHSDPSLREAWQSVTLAYKAVRRLLYGPAKRLDQQMRPWSFLAKGTYDFLTLLALLHLIFPDISAGLLCLIGSIVAVILTILRFYSQIQFDETIVCMAGYFQRINLHALDLDLQQQSNVDELKNIDDTLAYIGLTLMGLIQILIGIYALHVPTFQQMIWIVASCVGMLCIGGVLCWHTSMRQPMRGPVPLGLGCALMHRYRYGVKIFNMVISHSLLVPISLACFYFLVPYVLVMYLMTAWLHCPQVWFWSLAVQSILLPLSMMMSSSILVQTYHQGIKSYWIDRCRIYHDLSKSLSPDVFVDDNMTQQAIDQVEQLDPMMTPR